MFDDCLHVRRGRYFHKYMTHLIKFLQFGYTVDMVIANMLKMNCCLQLDFLKCCNLDGCNELHL